MMGVGFEMSVLCDVSLVLFRLFRFSSLSPLFFSPSLFCFVECCIGCRVSHLFFSLPPRNIY